MGTSSIVSSIEFDRDGDLFAVAGVTRKIKVREGERDTLPLPISYSLQIFDYNTIVSQQARFSILHYPLCEIPCQAKLRL